MNKKLLFLILLILFFISGCAMNEIEEYAFVAGIGIDYKDDEFEVTFEIFEENDGATTEQTSNIVINKGKVINEAVANITKSISQYAYLNHALIIVLSESIIINKFEETLNYLIHDARIRSSCYVVVSKDDTTFNFLNKSQELKQVISYNVYKLLGRNVNYVGIWKRCKLKNVLDEYIKENGSIIMPLVKYDESCVIDSVIIKNNNTNKIIKCEIYELFVMQLFWNSLDEGMIYIDGDPFYIKGTSNKLKIKDNSINLECNIKLMSYETKDENEKSAELNEKIKAMITKVFTDFQKS